MIYALLGIKLLIIMSKTVEKVREVLESPERRENMVNTNYEIATRHYSFAVLRRYLNMLLTNFFGVNI